MTQVDAVVSEAHQLAELFPDAREHIAVRHEETLRAWNDLLRQSAERKSKIQQTDTLQSYFDDYRDLMQVPPPPLLFLLFLSLFFLFLFFFMFFFLFFSSTSSLKLKLKLKLKLVEVEAEVEVEVEVECGFVRECRIRIDNWNFDPIFFNRFIIFFRLHSIPIQSGHVIVFRDQIFFEMEIFYLR